ncbi:hypothetical protein A6M27_04755 [Acidithiobacillus thiooxidans]|uniref:Bacterial sugar transferase domain-containing protein n=1 Tax=Acidithiobacillus thiooxidans TaxID=930 RepID=A0A1C2HUL8_ACITH|nr:sugar transferase [Acidithiobacillus thiooxidans]OCX67444.1 hypothetical protein A6O24_20855 [Acidithiobacillus thiooxidans]OCX67978.1 hypothetical protein A6P07_19085 [Acidithiobacillus thiooxidans]OCX85807.1 hypothetical protein A6O26_00250 [Acidithiobacillus thiooxidans]OCX88938.1 hypothetical protein A6M27_04755 [Acidithiobacillus thiooxidans]OFC48540.1 hypothetical protein BAE47_07560 [Acidithiobacillus thiooxidans]
MCAFPAVISGQTLKRALDLILAALALLCLSPLLLLVAAAIYLDDRGPVFFKQERIGKRGLPFVCFKFRSMHVDAERIAQQWVQTHPDLAKQFETDCKLRNDPRITRTGRFLRSTSLDELPQLVNVLRGEMSLVGPRPILRREIHRYGFPFSFYTQVRPGITGLWQVRGRACLSFDDRIKLDTEYVQTWSLYRDLRILLWTIPAVFSRKGAF